MYRKKDKNSSKEKIQFKLRNYINTKVNIESARGPVPLYSGLLSPLHQVIGNVGGND